jgi:AcrR family transcriptional regulator
MRIDAILNNTKLTKGAFYHHFKSKEALGLAVVDEVIYSKISKIWLETLDGSNDPIEAIQEAYERAAQSYGKEMLELGCPLNNLAQEMSPINEEFRVRINLIFHEWHEALMGVVKRGKEAGHIKPEVDPRAVATFILSIVEGSIGLAKNEHDLAPFIRCADEMERYLLSMRPQTCGQKHEAEAEA